ncbi:transketolase family protein [SAR202 cluster bacterium AD-804-J14_MRT_500m]|nr:transketolase family protein [SAR202 cluster bacterium AD-804-J14_MRT_500m]
MASTFFTASTREVYGRTLVELGKQNRDIVVLGGDLNKSTFTHLFAEEFPDRFFDFGPAEQNIMSVAAGLAASGKVPFVSTFAVFGMCRPFDQVRVSISQPALNVKIVCTHAGLLTGEDGMSAQAIEDLALACSLPSFNVVAPADSIETGQAITVAAETYGPFYIRLYRPATPVVHDESYQFKLGSADCLRDGGDATIITIGPMAAQGLEAAEIMAGKGVQCRVINLHSLRPLDEDSVVDAAILTGAVVTAEEHLLHGGLGSVVAQILARRAPTPMEMVALSGYAESGKPAQLMEKYNIATTNIVDALDRVMERKLN